MVRQWSVPPRNLKLYYNKEGVIPSQILRIWPGSQVVRQGSAKPLHGGSIPPRASKFDAGQNPCPEL